MQRTSLTIIDANVITLDPKQPRTQAIAVENGKIVAVGSNNHVLKAADSGTRIVDARGKTVVPGLVDCHVHMTHVGLLLQRLDLTDATSIKDIQHMLADYRKRHKSQKWILGDRWDQERLQDKRLPNRWDIDAAVPDTPVFLVRTCGHIGVANSQALKLTEITGETKLQGGKVDVDEKTGQPTGVLRENCMELVWKAVPKPGAKQLQEACRLACKKAVEAGLTCVHWLVTSTDEIQAIRKLDSEGQLPIRVVLGISPECIEEASALHLLEDSASGMVKTGFVKLMADGSLGARTAALAEPYSDCPETSGMMLYTEQELRRLVKKAHCEGRQLAIHAIGDRAVDAVLAAIENVLKRFPRKDHRHRIEHCSVLNPDLVGRMKRLGTIASIQPHFVVSDFWVEDRLGAERARYVYPFRAFVDAGVPVVSGSDCPVENISPLLGIWAGTSRQDKPEERLSAEELLRSYTVNAAYASFEEKEKGTIAVGKCADFTVLSDDPTKDPPEAIRDIKVETVIVDGKIVHSRKG